MQGLVPLGEGQQHEQDRRRVLLTTRALRLPVTSPQQALGMHVALARAVPGSRSIFQGRIARRHGLNCRRRRHADGARPRLVWITTPVALITGRRVGACSWARRAAAPSSRAAGSGASCHSGWRVEHPPARRAGRAGRRRGRKRRSGRRLSGRASRLIDAGQGAQGGRGQQPSRVPPSRRWRAGWDAAALKRSESRGSARARAGAVRPRYTKRAERQEKGYRPAQDARDFAARRTSPRTGRNQML